MARSRTAARAGPPQASTFMSSSSALCSSTKWPSALAGLGLRALEFQLPEGRVWPGSLERAGAVASCAGAPTGVRDGGVRSLDALRQGR